VDAGTILEVESLDRARRRESPARARLEELLAPKPDLTIAPSPPPSLQLGLVAVLPNDAAAAPPDPQSPPPKETPPGEQGMLFE
jgi:hypothetical protein